MLFPRLEQIFIVVSFNLNTEVVLFKGFDKTKNYSESGIINRKSGELVHEITRNINSETSEKDITFYNCKEINKNV